MNEWIRAQRREMLALSLGGPPTNPKPRFWTYSPPCSGVVGARISMRKPGSTCQAESNLAIALSQEQRPDVQAQPRQD